MNYRFIEPFVGFIVIVLVLLAGIVASGWYIWSDPQRQKGALALTIGLVLIAALVDWVIKDRKSPTADKE